MCELNEIIGNYYLAIDLKGKGNQQAWVQIEDPECRNLGVHVRQLRSGNAIPFRWCRRDKWSSGPGKYELMIAPPTRRPKLPPYYQVMIFDGCVPIPQSESDPKYAKLIVGVRNKSTRIPDSVVNGEWLMKCKDELQDPWPDPPPYEPGKPW